MKLKSAYEVEFFSTFDLLQGVKHVIYLKEGKNIL